MTDAPETDASFLAPVSGAGFWTVCQGYKSRLKLAARFVVSGCWPSCVACNQ